MLCKEGNNYRMYLSMYSSGLMVETWYTNISTILTRNQIYHYFFRILIHKMILFIILKSFFESYYDLFNSKLRCLNTLTF